MYILSIDLGTTGLKVALVNPAGDLLAVATRAIETILLPPHGAEQDPVQIWSSVIDAMRQVLHAPGVDRIQLAAITCTSQYFSLVPVDRDLQPVMNLMLWMDQRGQTQSHALYARHPHALTTWVEIHGMMPLPSGNDSLSHMLWVQEQRPEIHERTYKYLEPMDYVIARLTGECASTLCTAFPLLLTDNRDLSALQYSHELLGLAGVDPEKLAELRPIGSQVGSVRRTLAEDLEISPTTPVFVGINDTQAVAIGTATFRGRHGAINFGTTSQVLAHVGGKKSDLEHALISMPSAIAGRYMVMAENGLGGKPLDHFLRNMVFASDALADHSSSDLFSGIEAATASVPAGSDGLLFLPWLTGAQAPESHAPTRGGFLNLSLHTTRAHMVRAILEGVAFNMRWVLPSVEAFVDQEFEELLFSGGGAVSDAWAQILADVSRRPVAQLCEPGYVNNRATAFLGFVALGELGLNDIGNLCRIQRHYTPRREVAETYDKLFTQFVAAFEQNRAIFEALNG